LVGDLGANEYCEAQNENTAPRVRFGIEWLGVSITHCDELRKYPER